MPLLKWHQVVYAVNLSLLITHEIDSAYWQEWNLFGVPGGIQLFLILNLILILLALYGYSSLLRNQWSGYVISVLVCLAGIFAFSIHLYFIILGHPEFTLPRVIFKCCVNKKAHPYLRLTKNQIGISYHKPKRRTRQWQSTRKQTERQDPKVQAAQCVQC
jgi:hypothetical protein